MTLHSIVLCFVTVYHTILCYIRLHPDMSRSSMLPLITLHYCDSSVSHCLVILHNITVIMPFCNTIYYATLCYDKLWYVMCIHAMLCCVVLGYVAL